MKKFKFTLSRMRDYKNQLLDEEKNRLAAVRHTRDVIEESIQELEGEFARLSREMLEQQETGIAAFQLQAYSLQMTSLRRQLDQLRIELQQAEVVVQKQTSVVVQASQEVSKLDKLYDRQLEEYNRMVAKSEELLIEEFVSAKIARQLPEAETAALS